MKYALLGKAYARSESVQKMLVIGRMDALTERSVAACFLFVTYPAIFFVKGSLTPHAYKEPITADNLAAYLSEKVKGLTLKIRREQ
ncbi:hypothetical protein LSCM1_04071 [Leishmania martiniquensis]|uniref:Uncharacterized protein n=1 Tax=Leishmania martiniquensis TaxID=1580590 RepID=A0A836GM77_9TRYP|nr:hypothetical protein LSCM1_04071 [Leishmania martiniquensis]